MTRIFVVTAVLALGLSAAQAAPRQQNQQGYQGTGGVRTAPARLQLGFPTRPAWAAPGECFTDDGYGRFRSCSAGGRS